MTIHIKITSDRRGEGKTVLAWSLIRFLQGLGHEVHTNAEYPEREALESERLLSAIASRQILIGTE